MPSSETILGSGRHPLTHPVRGKQPRDPFENRSIAAPGLLLASYRCPRVSFFLSFFYFFKRCTAPTLTNIACFFCFIFGMGQQHKQQVSRAKWRPGHHDQIATAQAPLMGEKDLAMMVHDINEPEIAHFALYGGDGKKNGFCWLDTPLPLHCPESSGAASSHPSAVVPAASSSVSLFVLLCALYATNLVLIFIVRVECFRTTPPPLLSPLLFSRCMYRSICTTFFVHTSIILMYSRVFLVSVGEPLEIQADLHGFCNAQQEKPLPH